MLQALRWSWTDLTRSNQNQFNIEQFSNKLQINSYSSYRGGPHMWFLIKAQQLPWISVSSQLPKVFSFNLLFITSPFFIFLHCSHLLFSCAPSSSQFLPCQASHFFTQFNFNSCLTCSCPLSPSLTSSHSRSLDHLSPLPSKVTSVRGEVNLQDGCGNKKVIDKTDGKISKRRSGRFLILLGS